MQHPAVYGVLHLGHSVLCCNCSDGKCGVCLQHISLTDFLGKITKVAFLILFLGGGLKTQTLLGCSKVTYGVYPHISHLGREGGKYMIKLYFMFLPLPSHKWKLNATNLFHMSLNVYVWFLINGFREAVPKDI